MAPVPRGRDSVASIFIIPPSCCFASPLIAKSGCSCLLFVLFSPFLQTKPPGKQKPMLCLPGGKKSYAVFKPRCIRRCSPGWQPQRKPRSCPPWGCCLRRSGPSFPHERAPSWSLQTEHRRAYGPCCRSGPSWQGLQPHCRGAGYGPCRRPKPPRSTFCRSQWPTFYKCLPPDAGSGWGWWSCR